MSLDIWEGKLPLESEGGPLNMREAQIDCAGSSLDYCPDSRPRDSAIPRVLESKKALKRGSDPLP
jgi:hypothetical protein